MSESETALPLLSRLEVVPVMQSYLDAGARTAAHGGLGAPVRVLICEDNASMRALLRVTFDTEPQTEVVGEAENGMQAIFQAGCLAPDVVLLDLAMPVMDGLTAIPEIRRISKASKILVFSGFDSRRVGDIARNLGAEDFIEKGIPPRQLVDKVLAKASGNPRDSAARVGVIDEASVFKSAFNGATLGIGVGDPEGRPVFVNDTLEKMLGYGTGELDGKKVLEDITHPDDVTLSRHLLQELLAGDRTDCTFEKRFMRKDGSSHRARVTATLLTHGDKIYVLGMVQDLEVVEPASGEA